MKHAHLRAAAHNMADSISSECSFLGFDLTFPLWDFVDDSPQRRLRVDLLSGKILTAAAPVDRMRSFFESFASVVPEILAQHRCDPRRVAALEVEFRRSADALPSRREVLVMVEQADGRKSTDRYVGNPLRRARRVDALGRIRRERNTPAV